MCYQVLVTVCIVTRNRASLLRSCVQSIEAQDVESVELVVVDNNSTGTSTKEVVENSNIASRYVRLHRNFGIAPARNIAAANSCGKYILNVDDDAELAVGCISEAVAVLEEYEDAAVASLNVREQDKSVLPGESDGAAMYTFLGGGHLIRREAFEAAGYFNELFFRQGEEEDLAIRLFERDWSIVYAKEAVVRHYGDSSQKSTALLARALVNKCTTILLHSPYRYLMTDLPRRYLGYVASIVTGGDPARAMEATARLVKRVPGLLPKRQVLNRGYRKYRVLRQRRKNRMTEDY